MDFLQQIIEKLTSFIPRLWCCNPYQRGIRFTFGKYVKKLVPGWYFYTPLFQEILYMEVQSQIIDLRPQSLRTKDGVSVVISGALRYRVVDIEKAILKIQDIEKALETIALGLLSQFVQDNNFEDCVSSSNIGDDIDEDLDSYLEQFGIGLEELFITDLDKIKSYRLIIPINPQTLTGEE